MRQALLLLVLFLFSCAPRVPVSYQPPERPLPLGFKGRAHFVLHSPKGQKEGRLFYLLTREGVYAEALSPFGWSLFQGLLKGETLTLILVPQREIIVFYLHTPPPSLQKNWGLLFSGQIPPDWKVENAYQRGQQIEVYFDLGGGFKAKALFSEDFKLRELLLKRGRDLARFRYFPEEVWLEIPRLRTELKIRFLSRESLKEETPLLLALPAGFETKIYDLDL